MRKRDGHHGAYCRLREGVNIAVANRTLSACGRNAIIYLACAVEKIKPALVTNVGYVPVGLAR